MCTHRCKQDFNFLGVTLNQNLNWDTHISSLCSKASRCIGILSKLKAYFPISIMKILYHSLIISKFTYGLLAWGYNVSRIFKLQKKCIRIITNNKYNAHTDPLFKSLNLLKIHDIYLLNVLKFYYLYCHDQLPFYLQAFSFIRRSDIHNYSTRGKDCLVISKTRTKLAENTLIRNITPKVINDSPHCIISKDSIRKGCVSAAPSIVNVRP